MEPRFLLMSLPKQRKKLWIGGERNKFTNADRSISKVLLISHEINLREKEEPLRNGEWFYPDFLLVGCFTNSWVDTFTISKADN